MTLELADRSAEFTPALHMRPHHFNIRAVRWALLGVATPEEAAKQTKGDLGSSVSYTTGDFEYWRDVLGRDTAQGRANIQKNTLQFFEQLSSLEDNSFIGFDLRPDGLCQGCAIGKHCHATNYVTSTNRPHSVPEEEMSQLEMLLFNLESQGFKNGTDFVRAETYHELVDLNGRTLSFMDSGVVKGITFDSLIARTGALRAITPRYEISDLKAFLQLYLGKILKP